MLSLEPPYFEIEGIVVFRDHAVPTQFYYAAPQPKITRTGGRLMFDVFMYTVALEHSPLAGTTIPDELGAGFLTMGVDCALDDGKRSQIVRELADKMTLDEAQIALYPIPYHKGTVRVLALDKFSTPGEPLAAPGAADPLKGRPTFVEAVLGSSKPSLLGDLRTIFSLNLSQEGVVFLEGLYKDGAAPVGVVYELNFYGLRPAVQARITANLQRVYTHFSGSAGVRYAWFAADIDGAIKRLEESGDIKIELTSQAVGDEAQKSKDLALSLFRDRIVQELFRPMTQAPQFDASALTGLLMGGVSTATKMPAVTLKAHAELNTELKTVTYEFNERSPEERTHAPQGFLPVLLSKNEVEQRTHRVDLDHEFFQLLRVLVTGPSKEEFEALGIREVKVDLQYGQAGDAVSPESQTLLFRPDSTGDKEFAVKRRGRKSLSYTYALTYEFQRNGADADSFRYELPPRPATSRTLRINPGVDFGVLDVEVEPGHLHADISQVDVDLSYAAPDGNFRATDHFRLQTAAPAVHRWQVRTLAATPDGYSAAYTFRFQDNTVYAGQPQVKTDTLLQVDAPFNQERLLLVRPNVVSPAITHIDLEIEYDDLPNGYQRRFLHTLQAPFASTEFRWPILNVAQQKIRYRVTAHEPGFITEGEWQETSDPSIVVGSTGSRLATVKLQLLGPTLAEVGIDAVLFRVQAVVPAGAPEADIQSVLFDGSQTTQDVKLLIPPGGSLRYRYQTHTFKSDGTEKEAIWKESTTTLLPVSTRTL